jgi:HAD superfamily hydrolase (TIGR01549 family)
MENDIKLVIFDLDGTLIHLPINYSKLKCEVSRILGTENINSILKALSNAKEDDKKRIFSVLDKFENEALRDMREVSEGMKVYRSFRNKLKCLVTLQGRQVVEKVLKKTGLSFDYIVTREDALARNEQIKIIIKKFKLNPESILFVGDRESDKKAAEIVGCKFMLITGNFTIHGDD